MLKTFLARLKMGKRTFPFPEKAPPMPDRFRGLPEIDRAKCQTGCRACAAACPTGAVEGCGASLSLDLGRCLFCAECAEACPQNAIRFTGDFRLATRTREALSLEEGRTLALAAALEEKSRRLFGRSLKLRQVSAGGCNGCEADVSVLQTLVFDLGRFGIQFVASPRHADGLLVTGTVPLNMRLALRKTYEAIPSPRLVIAAGACAISGGPFAGIPEAREGVAPDLPVDLFIPGCPPHPWTTLDGLLRLLGRIEGERSAAGKA